MDFYYVAEKAQDGKKPVLDIFPIFTVRRSKDLMVRAKSFYAIWDEDAGLWSTDEFDVQRIVDASIKAYKSETTGIYEESRKYLANFNSNSWIKFRSWLLNMPDTFQPLDQNLTFANTEVVKEDFVSHRLPYPLEEGSISAWDELVGTLYSPEERAKIEWAIGAVMSGDSKHIQKFLVFYGPGGTGKSTIINIIQWLTEGYYITFEANALTGNNNMFSLQAFASNPLVAIQHDGDLSKIADNSKLNSVTAHEVMTINEKNKPSYDMALNAFLFMGTNKPVKITDAKSGIIRRLIDVQPTGNLLGPRKYAALMAQVRFELGAIAHHCLETYREMGKDYYSGYQSIDMLLKTDVFFNFIEAHFELFYEQDGTTLKQAWELYKLWCEDSGIEHRMSQLGFRDELHNYFDAREDRFLLPNGDRVRNWYRGFNANRFKVQIKTKEHAFSLVMDETESLFDQVAADWSAQYASSAGTPLISWAEVKTTLKDLDTSREHFVLVPDNHIVIDFDLRDKDGKKSAERNLEAASSWPATYAEYSKSGGGIHLHYVYDGAVEELSRVYDDGIEIKVFTGNSSLRRRVSNANAVPIATLNSGLPLREKKPVLDVKQVQSEKGLREQIIRNLRKEIHADSKSSLDFIYKILEDAYASGLAYDVSDMQPAIISFAGKSTNNSAYGYKLIQTMQFRSEAAIEDAKVMPKEERLVIFDTEVFPNLFVICWMYQGDRNAFGQAKIVKMVNPNAQEVEGLLSMKLVGYNCRRYDNHILFAASMGYTNEQLYKLSKAIIDKKANAFFAQAYNLSYADIFDYASEKKSLKVWEIELDIPHRELNLPWDEPVRPEDVKKVVDYCCFDVSGTDHVFEDRKADFVARQILADLSGLAVNATTQQHAARIIFGEEKQPQGKFKYTNLRDIFPGYEFDHGKSTYRGEEVGEGGLVRAKPGMYTNVLLLDVESMHPASIEALEAFGPYTEKYIDLLRMRVAIKRKDFESARKMFGGKLARYLEDEELADMLSLAFKIVINIVYGLTSASFDNAFKDPRNIDNIVAKRGALFMMELMYACMEKGYEVIHIKTDSIKIPAPPGMEEEIAQFVMEFGERYGYKFVLEATYDKFVLVNKAVYAAHKKTGTLTKKDPPHGWFAIGKEFQVPYVFKTLFSHEPIVFKDKTEAKSVSTSLWLDFEDGNPRRFVGRTGLFTPMSQGGALLLREKETEEGKEYHAATGTKGWKWMESEMVKELKLQADIDESYFKKLVDDAMDQIRKFGDAEAFVGP